MTNDSASLDLEPRLIGHYSQVVRTTMLPIAPPGQSLTTLQASGLAESITRTERGRTAYTLYTHRQASLIVSRYTTLVPPLRLRQLTRQASALVREGVVKRKGTLNVTISLFSAVELFGCVDNAFLFFIFILFEIVIHCISLLHSVL